MMAGRKLLSPTDTEDGFTDILFNALLGFAFMFIVAFALIQPKPTEGKITPKADYIITAQWPDNHPDDIDLIVEDPRGQLVWFNAREAGLMHLDRDDRGRVGDMINVNGQQINNPINQETVTLRGVAPGEYVVNILHYKSNTSAAVPVSVKVEKINPTLSVRFAGQVTLNGAGDEQTAVRFTIAQDGDIVDVFTRQKFLIRATDRATGAGK
jgi:hypothetical protein